MHILYELCFMNMPVHGVHTTLTVLTVCIVHISNLVQSETNDNSICAMKLKCSEYM